MKANLFTFFFILLITGGCQKPVEQLPPATQSGKNTIGFKVNGKVYSAQGDVMGLLVFEYVTYTASIIDSSIFIRGADVTGENKFDIWLEFKYKDTIGTYNLRRGAFFLGGNPNPDDSSGTNEYNISDMHRGKVTLTFFNAKASQNYMGSILAGTFQMDAVNKFGKVIHITDGRFDIND